MKRDAYDELLMERMNRIGEALHGLPPAMAAHLISLMFIDVYRYVRFEANIDDTYRNKVLNAMEDSAKDAPNEGYECPHFTH